ncbi:glycerophosphodiester phosphodiesterase [Niallia sp. 03133]|uniref:glycerophosphodiester phosphodiesterase n=1 Tax=Niallia sp. 03133 TaxID=3458060 RepID=UPI004044E37A
MRELFQSNKNSLVGAHRGASQYYPENTMLSFHKALELGADYIELDVHLTKDEVPVVIHDSTLERTTDGKGKIRDYTMEELKRFDAGSWFGKEFTGLEIPTLEEVLQWSKGRMGVNIELKQDVEKYAHLEEKVLEVIRKTKTINQIQVMSFNHKAVKKMKDLDANVFAGIILFAEAYNPIHLVKEVNADFFNTTWMFHSKAVIDELHNEGYLVCGGHCDDPEKWAELQSLGIDMAETNIPDVMKKVEKKQQLT